MRAYLGETSKVKPLVTPPELKGKEVIYKKNGVVWLILPYDANSCHPCYCGCIYDIIDVIDNPGGDFPIKRHRHIRTGEWTECELKFEPMSLPKNLLFNNEENKEISPIEGEPLCGSRVRDATETAQNKRKI